MKRTTVGSPINFRGFIYSPINEQGVVYLFGLVAEDLNIRVESVQQGYPDCTAIRYLGKGKWERVNIEFEYSSSNFILHDHDAKDCDIIVCWNDDLKEDQKECLSNRGVEIIELKSEIGGLDNPELEDPDKPQKKEGDKEVYGLCQHIRPEWDKTKKLFEKLDLKIKEINPEIWAKISKNAITYYSPEKVFIYLHSQKQGIKMHVFTNALKMEGVEVPYGDALKWGRIYLKNEEDLDKVVEIIKKSFRNIKEAIKAGLNTGWFAIPESEWYEKKGIEFVIPDSYADEVDGFD